MFVNFSLAMELQRALRRLVRAPGFSLSVIVLIALSIGGAAAVATAGWSLFARPLPYAQADQLVAISTWLRSMDAHSGLSEAAVDALNREDRFGTIAIVDRPFLLRLADNTTASAARIDHRTLGVLRVAPRAGRALTVDDTAPGADPVVLVSERFRRNHFGNEADVIDRVLELQDGRVRIVGVMPEELAMPASTTDLWLPMELGPDTLSPERFSYLLGHSVIARMPEDVTPEVLRDQLLTRLRSDVRVDSDGREFMVRPLRELWSAGQRDGLLILVAATGVVLLSAWFNLAGLWLARWTGRDRELAIQHALGARRGQAMVGIALEYVLLGLPGLILAMVVAWIGVEMLHVVEVLDDSGPLHAGIAFPTVAAGLLLLALGVLPVMGVVGWNMRRLSSHAAGSLGGRGTHRQGARSGVRGMLMVGQIAIACTIMMALVMLFSSWFKLLNEDVGFDSERLVTAMVGKADSRRPAPDAAVRVAVDRLRSVPGVQGVSWSNVVPFGRLDFVSGYAIDDKTDEHFPARSRSAGPDFFAVAGIEILSGRSFGIEDAGEATTTVIVDELFERKYLNGSALGRRIGYPDANMSVVGVVEPVRHNTPDEAPDTPTVYTYSEAPESQTQLLLRTSMAAESMIGSVREVLARELGAERISWVAGLDSMIRHSVRDREPQLLLVATFAFLALVLVFSGLYALQSYRVASGTADLGLRRAMGASRGRIIGAEFAGAARLLVPGLALGLPGGWLATRLIADELYKVGLADPGLWLATGSTIALTILMASLVPALRASRVEPLEALRHE